MIQKSLKLGKKKYEIILFLIIIFALIVRLVFFVGFDWSDSPIYAWLANRISSGDLHLERGLMDFRVMMYFPVALFFKLFGVNTYTATVWSLITSLGSIFIIYKIGELIFNKRTAIFSALLLSVFPIEIAYSTQLNPDVPLAFFIALSIFLFLKVEKSKKKNKLFYVLIGILGGLAYLFKETGMIVFLFFPIYMIYKRKIKLEYFFILIGLFIILFVESIYGFLFFNDFFARYHTVSEFYCEFFKPAHDLSGFPRLAFNLDNNWKFMYWNKQLLFGFFYYFFLLGTIYFLFKKQKEVYVVLIWFLVFLLYMQFGFQCFNPLIPLHILERHFIILNIPATLIVSYFLDNLCRNKFLRVLSILFLSFLIITSLYFTKNIVKRFNIETIDFDVIYDYLKKQPVKVIYADEGTVTQLNFRYEYKRIDSIKDLQNVKSCDEIKDSYVIVDGQRPWIDNPSLSSRLPKCIYEPPENWELLTTIKSVNREGLSNRDPKIYYAH
jgi:hypothetical protein